ncbi:hypothetical protein BDW02DRAFT_18480 [Decorospora gaudefroyi]|uniref:Uncharacterized protein n=1 Tax=Decorospora gaudefroyi TaxID=184978 RepID=A0A6A5K3F9_9PLEO|nr:hypothetical protein BDW02DRAFT_18480 [Decorospora gaudefroyi]
MYPYVLPTHRASDGGGSREDTPLVPKRGVSDQLENSSSKIVEAHGLDSAWRVEHMIIVERKLQQSTTRYPACLKPPLPCLFQRILADFFRWRWRVGVARDILVIASLEFNLHVNRSGNASVRELDICAGIIRLQQPQIDDIGQQATSFTRAMLAMHMPSQTRDCYSCSPASPALGPTT